MHIKRGTVRICYEATYISQFDSQKLTSQLLVEWTVADDPELQKTMGG